ncbi:MAG: DUF4738 domain-containing protein [Bacteroides sp.]
MKQLYCACVGVVLLLLTACSSRGNGAGDSAQLADADSAALVLAPQTMQVSDVKTTFTYQGKEYHSRVIRKPDSHLPIVQNEQGERFVDNCISLRIVREGKVIVDRTFTKDDFTSLVDARFMKYAILEGLVFDQTTPQGMIYAASVCYPQSDLYVPIRLTISSGGQIALSKEELMEDYQPDKTEDGQQ